MDLRLQFDNENIDFGLVANCNDFTAEIFDRWGLSLLKMTSMVILIKQAWNIGKIK